MSFKLNSQLKNFLDAQKFTNQELADIQYISIKIDDFLEFYGDAEEEPTDEEVNKAAKQYSAMKLKNKITHNVTA